jgi:hypothetical protein
MQHGLNAPEQVIHTAARAAITDALSHAIASMQAKEQSDHIADAGKMVSPDHFVDVNKMVVKSHAALRLALPLLERARNRLTNRFQVEESDEYDTAIKANRDALGEDGK